MLRKNRRKSYSIERSPLWQLRSQKEFSELLGFKKTKLKRLITEREFHYRTWTEIIDGKVRHIVVPVGSIRRIHEKLKRLLDRIQKPDYLYSPRVGYSPAMNAALHVGAKEAFKIDIQKFYPSTTREHVFRFCLHRLHMSEDVAGAFAMLATFEGKVPFGSPLSPVLCSLVHRDMFDHIDRKCAENMSRLSIWVDDLTISGENIRGELIHEVRTAIEAKGLKHHKEELRRLSKGIVITGAFISTKGASPTNKAHLKIRAKLAELDDSSDPTKRLELVNSLIGMTNQMRSTYSKDSLGSERARRRLQWLQGERRRLEDATVAIGMKPIKSTDVADEKSAPWNA
jgi:RNA-directed DNA polymerase